MTCVEGNRAGSPKEEPRDKQGEAIVNRILKCEHGMLLWTLCIPGGAQNGSVIGSTTSA